MVYNPYRVGRKLGAGLRKGRLQKGIKKTVRKGIRKGRAVKPLGKRIGKALQKDIRQTIYGDPKQLYGIKPTIKSFKSAEAFRKRLVRLNKVESKLYKDLLQRSVQKSRRAIIKQIPSSRHHARVFGHKAPKK